MQPPDRPSPAVSVIMGVYNAETHLAEAIDSILGQTFADFELIIVDNASTDKSVEIVQGYADPRIRLIRNPENRERCFSRNLAVEHAAAPLIAMMDADDCSLPHRLERQVGLMRERPGITVCGGFVIGYEQNILKRVPETDAQIRVELLCDSCLLNPTVMFRKEAFLRTGGYRDEFLLSEDYDLWARLCEGDAHFANIPEPLLRYRTYPGKEARAEHLRLQKERADRIRLRLVRRLAPEITGDECAAHLQLINGKPAESAEQLLRCRDWLKKLLAANERLRLYDDGLFRDMWLRHWLFLCRKSLSFPLLRQAAFHSGSRELRKPLGAALLRKMQLALLPRALWGKDLHRRSL